MLIAEPLIFHSHFVEPLGLFHPSPPSLLDCTVCQQRRLCQEYPPGSQTGHENYGPSKFNLLFFLTGRITLITRRRKILLFCLFQIQILLIFMQNMKLLLDKVKRDSWTWRGDIFKLKLNGSWYNIHLPLCLHNCSLADLSVRIKLSTSIWNSFFTESGLVFL